ncbi:MAG: hypothetical protein WCT19_02970 [Candidatus Paceibacterota bacterium]
MKKKTELVFVPVAGVPGGQINDMLEQYRERFLRRGMEAIAKMEPPRVIGTFEETFPQGEEGTCSCSLNSYIDAGSPDMRVINIGVTYEDALIPYQYKWEIKLKKSTFRLGEIRTGPFASEKVYISPIIKCSRDQKIVTIHLELDGRHDEDLYRRAILDAEFTVERIVWQVRCTRQLVQAFRSNPQNKGFIERSITELYVAIGKF